MLPWATMYQVDGVFKYLVEAMSRDNQSKDSKLSDDWLVEFAIRSKHPTWLMLVPDRFVIVESLNLSPQDLILAITELANAEKDIRNNVVKTISFFVCQQQGKDEKDLSVPKIFTKTGHHGRIKYFDRDNYNYGESDYSEHSYGNGECDCDCDEGWGSSPRRSISYDEYLLSL
eukprot:sb/3472084/